MRRPLLFITVFAIATCGLVYELVVGTLASYLLGDSVFQFSTVIGVYLFALGIGSFVSRYIESGVAARFVDAELAVALIGGASAPILFLTFTRSGPFHFALYATVVAVGTLVGLEIPLLLRILKDRLRFKDLVSQVLTFDYLGALLASLLFPIVLVPRLGLVRTSLAFGLLNALVGLWSTWLLKTEMTSVRPLRVRAFAVAGILLAAFASGDRLTQYYEEQIYADEVVHAESSAYQRIAVTRGRRGFALFLNGSLQFASADEYRYHEALVHPAMIRARSIARVLILGGGDGLAAREVLRYAEVKSITLVDIDPAITALAGKVGELAELNRNSLRDPRMRVVNEDAMRFLAEGDERFDVAIADFPDPNNFSLGKLYTTHFYRLLQRRLAEDGIAVIQSTSPLFARRAFWCVDATLRAAGFWTEPYHAHVPSFGEWGYILAARGAREPFRELPLGLRFLTETTLATLFEFPADMSRIDAEVNRLNNQVLVRYYEDDWKRWN